MSGVHKCCEEEETQERGIENAGERVWLLRKVGLQKVSLMKRLWDLQGGRELVRQTCGGESP